MSKVYLIGDLHFGHKYIHDFRNACGPPTDRGPFADELDHREYVIDKWNAVITKRDTVYVLGDAAFTQEGLIDIGRLAGRKHLVAGNHDDLPAWDYLRYFVHMRGCLKYHGHWLTHIPMHPQELYRGRNIHGHCHTGGPDGPDYFNVCLEFIDYQPKLFTEIVEELDAREPLTD